MQKVQPQLEELNGLLRRPARATRANREFAAADSAEAGHPGRHHRSDGRWANGCRVVADRLRRRQVSHGSHPVDPGRSQRRRTAAHGRPHRHGLPGRGADADRHAADRGPARRAAGGCRRAARPGVPDHPRGRAAGRAQRPAAAHQSRQPQPGGQRLRRSVDAADLERMLRHAVLGSFAPAGGRHALPVVRPPRLAGRGGRLSRDP